jgi:DNA mismatch repair protein MutH
MTLDIDAIAEALATRYSALTPPTGYTAIHAATSHAANAAVQTPYLIVWTRTGELVYSGGGLRQGETDFDVVLYLDRAQHDMPRETERLQKWVGVLLDATHAATKLGLSATVLKALPVSWEIDDQRYAGPTYDILRIRVRVWTEDTVTLVA